MSANQKEIPVVFTGTTREYFGIWIVNLLLSILTLGIYSAWAKVRRKKYFYNNTLIDGLGFDYHAKPSSILKGRIIAFVFFIAYTFSAQISPVLPAVFGLIFFIALPWLVIRTMTFNARNTSHRGLRFDFAGKMKDAIRVFFGLPLLSVISFGLAVPYAAHQRTQFLMNNHRFGFSRFEMQRVVKQFYLIYLKLLAIPFLIGILGIVAAVSIPAYQSYLKKTNIQAQATAPAPADYTNDNTLSGVLTTNDKTREITADTNQQKEPNLTYENSSTVEPDKNVIVEKLKKSAVGIIVIFLAVLFYLFFILSFVGYLQARLGNLTWNNTVLDQLSFKSSLRARDFIWLYFSNLLAILLTFGLATPWAQIRMARYRTSKLKIVGDVDFDQFVGDKKAEVAATGEELADFFDVDISFG